MKPRYPYLFHCNGKGAIVDIPHGYTSEQWGKAQDAFVSACGRDPKTGWVDCIHLYSDCVAEGVGYDWELAGPGGASFRLHRMPNHTPEQIEKAKAKLRRDQDVVRMMVLRIKELIDFDLP